MPSSSNPTEQFDIAAEVFFGKTKRRTPAERALQEAGFDIEPLPDNLAGDGGQTVWMMAYAGLSPRRRPLRDCSETVRTDWVAQAACL